MMMHDIGPQSTYHETNIAPENWWLEDEFPFGMAYFHVQTVRSREGFFPHRFQSQISQLFDCIIFHFTPNPSGGLDDS